VRLKLDENLGRRAAALLRAEGHDVSTVHEQAMSSATDAEILETCQGEGRALVTLDMDFANRLRFEPSAGAGIAVLRVPDLPSRDDLDAVVRMCASALNQAPIAGRLWVIDKRRARQYEPGDQGPGRTNR
jgi:predicted nuclease of predicted toxin-antitoxin system